MTKTLLMVLVAVSSSMAFASDKQEAQVIGTAKRVANGDGQSSSCSFSLKFKHYRESNACKSCGLSESEASEAILEDVKCKVADGQEVSGVLVKKDGKISLED